MILATGINKLDTALKDRIGEAYIVGYKEHILKGEYAGQTVVTSPILGGAMPFDKFLFELKKRSMRVILLLDNRQNPLFMKALSYGILDILLYEEMDGITVDSILDLVENPKTIDAYEKHIERIRFDAMAPEGENAPKAETAEKAEKVVIKKEKEYIPIVFSYRRRLISLIGDIVHVSELARMLARLTEYKIILLNFDFLSGYPDVLVEADRPDTEKTRGDTANDAVRMCEEKTLEKDILERMCAKPLPNLLVLSGTAGMAEYEKNIHLDCSGLVEYIFRQFDYDLVLYNLPKAPCKALESASKADETVIIAEMSFKGVKEAREISRYLIAKSVPLEKIYYIGAGYKKGLTYEETDLKLMLSDNVLGRIPADPKRDVSTAYGGTPNNFTADTKKAYEKIIRRLNILPKETLVEKTKKLIASLKGRSDEALAEKLSAAKEEAHNTYLMSITDHLTKVYNRKHFEEELLSLSESLSIKNMPLSLLMLDIDHFKKINDTYGHDAGDKVLAEFCKRIRDNIKKADLLGRLGGEEFGVILPYADKEEAIKVAERIREAVSLLPIEPAGMVTCSIGVASLKKNDKPESILKRADIGLYRAKNGGRNRVVMEEDENA